MADDFKLIIEQMRKEREDKKLADKRAEDKAIANDTKQLKAFKDAKKKDTDTLLGFRNALQESLKKQEAAEKRRAKEGKQLTKKAAAKFKAEQDAIKEKTKELLDSRKLARENERIRLEDRADRIRDREEIKDIRSKERKELDERKSAFEKFKESIAAKGEDPEKNAQVREEGIKLRKEEFALRVKNLEGTDLMAARLEELGNDLKDKGLDPEKNKAYQKESLKLQRAQYRERLKNAESRSERKEIKKEQFAKDKRALGFMARQSMLLSKIGDKFSDMIPSQEGIATGFMGFIKKAALIGLLFMLPKILNSQTAKDFVKYMETDGIPAIKNFFTGMLGFFKGIKEGGFGFLLESAGQNLKDVFDPDKETSFIAKLLAGTTLLLGLKAFGIIRAITGFLGAMTFTKGLFTKMMNKLNPNAVPDTSTTTTTKAPKTGLGNRDPKKLTRYERKMLKQQGLQVNKAGQMTNLKGEKVDLRKKANKDKLAAAMKKFPNYGRVAKIAGKMGPIGKIITGGFLVQQLLSGKSPAELAPQIGGLFGGLAMAGLGGTAGAAIGTMLFPGIGTAAGGILGGILGGLGGDMIGTALTEYMLGLPLTGFIGRTGRFYRRFFPKKDDAEQGSVDNATVPDARSSMGSYGQAAVNPSNLKTTPNQDASQVTPLNAGNMFPAENAQINQTIIDSSRKTSNNNYQQSNQNVTRNSYGMTNSVFNSI